MPRRSSPIVAMLMLLVAAGTGCNGSVTASDAGAASDTSFFDGGPSDASGATTDSSVPFNINDGFIGSACESDADCMYPDARCLTEAEGFPGGMCSMDCDLFCPDQEGAVTTFCLDPWDIGITEATGLCAMRCAYGESPTGCRPGYQCVPLSRFNDPSSVVYVCVPGTDVPFELSGCHEELLNRGVGFTPGVNPLASPSGNPGLVCDVLDPVWIDPVLYGVAYRPGSAGAEPAAIFASCELALALERTANLLSTVSVTDIVHWGTYNCRVIAGTNTLSQHGLANAIDIAALRNADGSIWTVLDDWEMNQPSPVTQAGAFLLWFAQTLFDDWIFNIILTPDYNAAHEDHFHCDMTPGSHFLQ